MADILELSDRVRKSFKSVPKVDDEDSEEWVEQAMNAHGFDRADDVPPKDSALVMLYAQAEGATDIALRTASYFSYDDSEESVDKTEISKDYRLIAKDLWNRYNRRKSEGSGGLGGATFTVMSRADGR